ncbi:unnamed protein product, partial [Ilex paraguariensis]
GDPTRIALVKKAVTSVCADVIEYHPTIKNWHIESYGKTKEFHNPKAHLRCGPGSRSESSQKGAVSQSNSSQSLSVVGLRAIGRSLRGSV